MVLQVRATTSKQTDKRNRCRMSKTSANPYTHRLKDEVALIKCFDSLDDGRARRVPHTAFTNPDEEDKYARESIEVRALVFYDD